MKLWPPCSEIMEFLISTYCIFQLTSVKFCTLLKDENRAILIFFQPWSPPNTSTVMAVLSKNEGFELPTDLLLNDISST